MKILIMGGSQFVGRAIAKKLMNRHEVEIFTRGKLRVDYEVKHIKGDRFCDQDLSQVSKNYDVVVDVSAYTGQGVTKLLEHTRVDHYILISSGAVYAPTMARLTEDHDLGENRHWGSYGLNKIDCELALNNQKHTIFRPSYIYGPGNNLHRQSYFMACIHDQQPIFLPEGDHQIQLVHIDDVTAAVDYAISHGITGVYNLTYEEDLSFHDICRGLMAQMGQETPLVTVRGADMATLGISHVREFFPYRNVTYLMDGSAWSQHLKGQIDLASGLKTILKTCPQNQDPGMTKIKTLLEVYHDQTIKA